MVSAAGWPVQWCSGRRSAIEGREAGVLSLGFYECNRTMVAHKAIWFVQQWAMGKVGSNYLVPYLKRYGMHRALYIPLHLRCIWLGSDAQSQAIHLGFHAALCV